MAFNSYIDPRLNCVFVRHFGHYTENDAHDQMLAMLAKPDYRSGINIFRDSSLTPFPSKFNFEYFKNSHPSAMDHIEQQLGKCNIALVVGSARDFAIAHQLSISTRLTPAEITRKPFREISDAKAWLEIPQDYEIKFAELVSSAE